MKRVLFALAAVCGLLLNNYSYAQPGNLEGDVISGTWNNTQTLTDLGAFRQYRGQRTGATGNGNFLYNPAPGDYSAQWTGSNAPNFVRSLNTYHNGGAFYYTTGGWNTNLQIAMTNGNYYTWNLLENGAANSSVQILETTFNPVTFSSITSAWAANGQRTVTVTMSAAPAGGENVFCRFSTDGYANSTLVQFSFVGNVGTATIPAQAQGANVQLYAYSSNKSSAAIGTDVGGNGQAAHDLATLNLSAGLAYTQHPVHVLSTTGTSGGVIVEYATLKAAFDAINPGVIHTGAVAISILGNTTETAPAVLNQVAGVTTISIQPAGGAARTISGAIVAGSPLIDLNGADNVTIDGLNTGGNSLAISNTTISTTAGTSTIRFINDASTNTVQNCTVAGSSTVVTSATVASGTILFSTGTTTGNDGNIINNNTITSAGTNLPSCAISCLGTSIPIDNSGIQITNNNIQDYFLAGSLSCGIHISNYGSTWTITGNKFFQTATRTATSGGAPCAIKINSSGITSGNGYVISNNVIGFANAAGTGTTFYTGANNRFIAMDLAVGTSVASSVQGNIISGINQTTTSGATTANGIFTGIYVTQGNVNIGTTTGNTIGNPAANNFLFITSTTSLGLVNGIASSSTGTVNIQNNTISSFGFGGTATIGYTVAGISTAGTAGIYTISANTIGSTTTANSIGVGVSGTTTATCSFFGIRNSATGATSITNNTIQNCTTYGTGANVLRGIENSGAASTLAITGNSLLSFSMPASATGTFTAISNSGAVTSSVSINNNFFGNASFGLITYGVANSGALTVISNTAGAATATLAVQTNDIRGIVHSVAGSSAHTYILNSATTLSQNISSNTFTNLNVNTTGSITFISNNVALPTGGSVTANSNSIVTAFNKGGPGGTVTLYLTTTTPSSVAGTTKSIQSNNFSNITLTGATTMAGWVDIEGASGGGSTKTIANNTFSNWSCGSSPVTVLTTNFSGNNTAITTNTINNITGTGAITGIVLGASNGSTAHSVTGNTITNLVSSGTGGSVVGIQGGSTSVTTMTITENTIGILSSTTTIGVVNGINILAGATTSITRNKIYDLSGNQTATTVNGINISSGTTFNINNNLIGDLRATAATGLNAINGLNLSATSTYNVYNNTIYLNASSSSVTTFGNSCITFSSTVTTLVLRNNILTNGSTPAQNGSNLASNGIAACLRISSGTASTVPTVYNTASNNNAFWCNPAAGTNNHMSYVEGIATITDPCNTVANLKTFMANRDQLSVEENPTWLSTVGSNANFLHINTTIATQIESGGATIAGITTDFDGDTRNATTPDIGADEFAGVPADLTGPAITYTALANSCSTGDAALNGVTITDASGVPTTGSLVPRIYYRKGAGSWFSQPGTLASGSGTNGTWNFTIVAADMGGLAVTDVVSYYVIAQDVVGTPNIASNAAGAVASDVNTVTTAPSSPASYTVLATLSGTYTVGAAGNFATLTAAVAAFNTSCVIGAVVFNLIDNSYTTGETFPITINNNVASSSSNTLTIKPTLANTTISGTSATALLVLNGGDYVTIDGSISSTANTVCPASAASRDLTLTNTNTSTSSAVIWIQTAASGTNPAATDNAIKNCNIVGNSNTTTFVGVGSGSTTIGSASFGNGNNNNSIINNNISKTQRGIFTQGASAAAKNIGTVINQNLINTASANNVGAIGIYAGFENGIIISGNTIDALQAPASADGIAIALGSTGVSTSTFTGNEVINATVTHNTIGSVRGASTFSAVGIYLTTTTNSGTTLIANNMIYGVNSNGTVGDLAAGIFIGNVVGTVNVFYNSVTMVGTLTGGTYPSFALASTSNTTVLIIRNNIFTSTGSTGANLNRAMGFAYSTYPNLTSNNNDLYASGTGAAVVQTVNLTNTGATSYTTITGAGSWNAASSQDAASLNVVPNFISPTNLHLALGTNGALNAAGTPLSVTTDFDCVTRDASTPDIGADEFVPVTDDASVTGIQMPPTFCAGAQDVKVNLQNLGAVNLNSVTVDWTVNGVPQAQQTFTGLGGGTGLTPGNTEILLLGSFTFVAGTSYTIVATSSLPNGNADANTSNDTFTLSGIQTGLLGAYTVGTGGDFTTLTLAAAAFNTRSLCGAVTFNLINASYPSETYPITFNNNANSSATNTLTIKATQASTSFTGSSATALIVLNGADYITIDGSISSTANTVCPASAASRDLTFNNTNAGTSSAVIWLQTAASGTNPAATNNTIKNSNLNGSGAFQTLIGVGAGAVTIGTSSFGTGNNNNAYINNNITNTGYGIYSQGASAGAKNSGTVISQNQMTTTASMKGGIWTGFENNITITGNSVSDVLSSGSLDVFGITCGFGAAMTTTSTAGNEVTNATITHNTIGTVANTGAFSAYGIGISTSATGTNLIANNMVYGVSSNGTSPDFAAGIVLGGGAATTNVFYNTVSMQGTIAGATAATQASACLAITNITGPTVNIRNNIFTNTQQGNTGATLKMMAIGLVQTTFAGFTCNNNVLYSAGAGPGTYMVGITGGISTGTARTTLANWQGATGTDAASVSMLPAFVSSTNLRVDGSNGLNGPIDNIGIVVSTTTDIDCATRSVTTPDPGVNEFAVPVCFGTPTAGTASAAPAGPFCNSGNTTISVTGFTSALGITFQWQASVTGLPGSFSDISGATSSSLVITGLSTTNYYQCVVTCSFSALSATTNAVGVIVNPNPTVTVTPSAPVLCGPGASTLTASGADTYSWSPATGLSATTGAAVTATLTSTTTYTVTGTTTATGCTGSTNVTVTVAPAATPVTVVATPDPVCQGSVVNLSATVPSGTFTLLNENFNGATNNWTTTNTSTGGTPADAAWTLRPNGYVYTTYGTWNSNDNSQFYLSNSDDQGSGTTATILQSPAFNLVGLTSATLSFFHHYDDLDATDAAIVEVSTNGTTWTPLQTYTTDQGTKSAFANASLSLNAYVGNSTVYVRFKFNGDWTWWWAIDNVTVTTPITYTYAWSSDVGGFTSTAAAPTHNPNVNTDYTVIVTNNFGCTGTDNEPVAVIPAPSVFAGPDQNTCGTAPYAITGATAQNTTGVSWTTTGSGTFTGTGTLTPTYTPTPLEVGSSLTFYLSGTGNAPCLATSDSLVLTIAPLNTYYLDNDGDGFGNPFLSTTACTQPGGYVTDNTDCNDSDAALNPYTNWYGDFDGDGYGSFIFLTSCANPGLAGVVQQGGDCDDNNPAVNPASPEICQNYIDDNCDGQVDENCSGIVNDNRVNAISVVGSLTSYPTCASISGSCLNAAISPEGSSAYVAAGGGRDVWYKFVAPSPGVHIKLTPNGFNGLIELQTAAGVYVDHENANTTTSGLDILNRAGLTTGATYFVAVRNYDNSAGGTFTLCISPLMDSNCDNGSGTYPMCSNLKADYTGANNYTFNFDPTGATTGSNTSGTAAGQIYLNPAAPLNLQYSGTYDVTIDANYTGLVDGLGAADPITVVGTQICNVTLTAQPNVQTKATQLCGAPATLLKGSILQGKPFVCSAINFTIEFTQLNACAGTAIGMPFYGTTTGASASINLSTVAGVTGGGKWYRVSWRPNFASGPGVYGTPSVIFVGGAVMGTSDNAISNADTEKSLQTIEAALYPNPNNGEMLNLNLTNVDAKEVFVRITDGMGKLIYTNLFVVEGSLNTQVRFEKPLSAGLYLVEFIANDESTTLKMIVER
jgi:Putative metal-binding motif/Secretion system C-terminal sorting domain